MNNNLVINWHLLEPCQLNCRYCYAEWNKASLPLIFRSEELSRRLIEEIASLKSDNTVRLSFAGGEPLLDVKISGKIARAHAAGLELSLITNGDLLPRRLGTAELRRLSMLGVSIDSFILRRNKAIGRITASGRAPDYDEILRYLRQARSDNPDLKIKINTVINRFNFDDDMAAAMTAIAPDKWKALRVLPATAKSAAHVITDEQFAVFRAKHRHLPFIQFEDNDDMANSYLMLDPYGRFFFNTPAREYAYSPPVTEVGIRKALESVRFDRAKFIKRYPGGVQ